MSTLPATITPAMARLIEIWPTDRLVPYAKNARTHSTEQVAQIAASIVEFGFVSPILVDSMDGIDAGHDRLLAARKWSLAEVPVVVLGHLSEIQRRSYVIADNQLALNAGWNDELLRGVLESLGVDGFNLALVGLSDEELVVLLGSAEPKTDAAVEEEAVPEPPPQPVTMPGDVWLIGRHRLICGDCRDAAVVEKLMAGARANVAITSPPYATQREYDPTSGFKPVPPENYVEWFRAVAAGVESVLAPDGSYLLNIKAHADDGERNLYVMDLDQVEAAITPRTVGIIPVYIYGHPVDVDQLMAIAAKHHLWVIEDCAQSQGAKYKGRTVGSIGDFGAFSFFPSKNLTVLGDGGCVTTNNTQMADRLRMLRNHGRQGKYDHEFPGYNVRFNEINAAIGRVMLKHLDGFNDN